MMIQMNLEDNIKELSVGFFQTIGAGITENGGIYQIDIPATYQNYFQTSKLSITFEKDLASANNVQLIIPGSNILSLIIQNCKQKGPISVKKLKTNTGNSVIRYHFFIRFIGISNMLRLEHVDVNIDNYKITNIDNVIMSDSFVPEILIDSKNITPSYATALVELKQRYAKISSDFITNSEHMFQQDYTLFVNKYDSQIRELDKSIYRKEGTLPNLEKIKKYRFETVDEIEELELEKKRLIETIQKKHKILFEYGLVACEILII